MSHSSSCCLPSLLANEPSAEPIVLYGFNNLSKSLAFSLYRVGYAPGVEAQAYLARLDATYDARSLGAILTEVVRIIDANILNVSRFDYAPHGASVTILMCEEPIQPPLPAGECVVAHLDKSHVCAHTYPEAHPSNGIASFRVDVDISTCGMISPLRALDFLLEAFDADIVTVDYRVRGFTRDKGGRKHSLDHRIASIRDFIARPMLARYRIRDVNHAEMNCFHSTLCKRETDGQDEAMPVVSEQRRIRRLVRNEINAIAAMVDGGGSSGGRRRGISTADVPDR